MEIENILKTYGSSVVFATDTSEETHNCFFEPIRHKNRVALSINVDELGQLGTSYYLLIAPGNVKTGHDSLTIKYDGKNYKVKKSDKVYFRDKAVYLWAVLAEI